MRISHNSISWNYKLPIQAGQSSWCINESFLDHVLDIWKMFYFSRHSTNWKYKFSSNKAGESSCFVNESVFDHFSIVCIFLRYSSCLGCIFGSFVSKTCLCRTKYSFSFLHDLDLYALDDCISLFYPFRRLIDFMTWKRN